MAILVSIKGFSENQDSYFIKNNPRGALVKLPIASVTMKTLVFCPDGFDIAAIPIYSFMIAN